MCVEAEMSAEICEVVCEGREMDFSVIECMMCVMRLESCY